MIDPNFLESDEFTVECEVRNIRGPLVYQLKELGAAYEKEFHQAGISPGAAHQKASKNPRQEIFLCSNKLREIRISLEHAASSVDPKRLENLDILSSRILHIKGRLHRISTSKTVGPQTVKLQELADKILSLVNDLKVPDVDLEKSIKSIQDIQVRDSIDNLDFEGQNDEPSEEPPKRQIVTPNMNQPSTSADGRKISSSITDEAQPDWPELDHELSMLLDDLSKRVKQLPQAGGISKQLHQK